MPFRKDGVISILPWDIRFFGFPTTRILPSRLEEMELREVLAGLARQKVSLVY